MFKYEGRLLKLDTLAWDWPGFNLMNKHVLPTANGFGPAWRPVKLWFWGNKSVGVLIKILTSMLMGGSP